MEDSSLLNSSDVKQRRKAAESLCLLGPDASSHASELVQACADSDQEVRDFAVAALEEIEPDAADLQSLAGLAGESNPLVAYWALTLLGRTGDQAKPYQDQIAAVLNSGSETAVQERAAWALGRIHADSPAAKCALTAASERPEPRLSRLARSSLQTEST